MIVTYKNTSERDELHSYRLNWSVDIQNSNIRLERINAKDSSGNVFPLKEVSVKSDTVYVGGDPLAAYTFKKNYYFMAGDYVFNSQDSLYWGLLPEEHIVGKAFVVWKSKDPRTGKWRWKRFFTRI